MKKTIYLKKQMLVLLALLLTTPVLWAGNITVTINDHSGNELSDAKFKIFKGQNYLGEHTSGSTVALQDGDTFKIFAHHNSTSTDRLVYTVDGDGNLTFQTTLVKIHFGGSYLDYRGSGGWKPFNGPSMELFPNDFYGNTMRFRFGDHWQNKNYVEKTVDYSGQTTFEGNAYTFKVKNEDGVGIPDVPIEWHYNTGYDNTYKLLGKTDANGMLVSIGDVTRTGVQPFRAKYNKTSQTKSTSGFAEFQTTVATALVENCEQGPIAGVLVEYLWHNSYTNDGYRINVGTTDDDGKASIELFESDNLKFRAKLNHTYSLKTFDLEANNEGVDVEFNPTLVNMNYAGDVKWKYNNYYYTDVTPDYLMFPGTYKFRFSGADNFTGTHDIDVSGCEFGGNVYIFKVKNEGGEGVANIPIFFHYNAGYDNTYKEIGKTDADGMLFSVGDVWKTGNQPFKAVLNKTSQRKETTGYTEFQTTVATALVQNCEQGPIAGVLVEYLWHNSYTNDGYRINVGTTDDDGEASIELFESDNLKFRAKLNHTYSLKTFDLESNDDVDVEFNPTVVNMNYAGDVKWKYNNYYYTNVTPDYLMFPGTYNFKFSGTDNFTGTHDIDVSGCEFGGNVYIFEVKNEAGEGIEGVPINWNRLPNNANTHREIGKTDANGMLFSIGDIYGSGNQTFEAKYRRTSQIKVTSGYTEFQTAKATARVLDHSSNPMAGVNIEFLWHNNYDGDNYRINVGTTGSDGEASTELFPGENRRFRATFNRTNSTKTFNLSANTDVDVEFQTSLATALVKDENENFISGVKIEFLWHTSYENGWYNIDVGNTGDDGKASIELFPVENRRFKATYNGTYYKTFDLEANGDVVVEFTWDGDELKSGIIGEITDDVVPEFSYKIYPVPARTELNVNVTFEAKEKVHVQVVDISGRVMKQDVWMLNKGLNTMKVDVNDLVDGQYIFLLKSDGRVIKDKFSVFKN